jgi:K+-sensing histidine kinase KdpD
MNAALDQLNNCAQQLIWDVPDVKQDDHDLIFTVSDTGPGISREYVDRIFEKFFRVPQKGGPTGAGLGLSIVMDIVEVHGGNIQLQGNAGSTFVLKLPLEQSAPAVERQRTRELAAVGPADLKEQE